MALNPPIRGGDHVDAGFVLAGDVVWVENVGGLILRRLCLVVAYRACGRSFAENSPVLLVHRSDGKRSLKLCGNLSLYQSRRVDEI